jgi:hypothetical protein
MMTDRKTAEAARRRVIEIDDLADATLDQRWERTRCLMVWNNFCAEESQRLAARRRNGAAAECVAETYRKLGWS